MLLQLSLKELKPEFMFEVPNFILIRNSVVKLANVPKMVTSPLSGTLLPNPSHCVSMINVVIACQKQCTDKCKDQESGQGLNPHSALDQGLNSASGNNSVESLNVQGIKSVAECSENVRGMVSITLQGQCEAQELNHYHDTVHIGFMCEFCHRTV